MRSDQAPDSESTVGQPTVGQPLTPADAGQPPADAGHLQGDAGHPQAGKPTQPAKRTRSAGLWVAATVFAVILLLLLIFILQNGQHIRISYLGAHGHLPLGVALILAAVCGALLIVIAGSWRILELRRARRKQRRS